MEKSELKRIASEYLNAFNTPKTNETFTQWARTVSVLKDAFVEAAEAAGYNLHCRYLTDLASEIITGEPCNRLA